jgi:hypothetical protein
MLTYVYLDTQTGNQFAMIDGYLISVNARCTSESVLRFTANGGEMHSHCRIIDRRWTVDASEPDRLSADEARALSSF